MKTLYLECTMGAAGDMLMAALSELIPDRQSFLEKMNSLGLPGVRVEADSTVKCGVCGTRIRVFVHGEEEEAHDDGHLHRSSGHHHAHSGSHDHSHGHGFSSLQEVDHLIASLDLPEEVRSDAIAVYRLIAGAESEVHGLPVSEVHFHEVGAMDAVTDVVGVCLLMNEIGAEEVLASPIHVGSGTVKCMHGILPVPAPATALLLKGIPTYGGEIQGELCTPTGAALLKHFVSRFGDRPVMRTKAIGYGMGSKDFAQVNCIRAFLGSKEGRCERITRLECNLDDMPGEEIGFAMEQLFESGARDVYTQAIGMKKSRPGVILSVICLPEDADRLAAVMLKHTTTLGIRREDMSRYVLDRSAGTVSIRCRPDETGI